MTQRTNKRFYVSASLAVFALSFAAFWLTAVNHPVKAEKAKNLRGAEAVNQYVLRTTAGFGAFRFGLATDKAVPNSYINP